MTRPSFADRIRGLPMDVLRRRLDDVTEGQAAGAVAAPQITDAMIPALFSRAAQGHLETMARRAAAITERRFGKVINLFAPLYLSNECANICLYCGFSMNVDIPRRSLTTDEVVDEAEHLRRQGFRHLLLVSGEHRGAYSLNAMADAVEALRGRFASVSIEVFPMETPEYRRLETAGVDGLTLYQETYDPDVYARLHTKGPKSRYEYRLHAIEKGGEAGFRTLGIGALLGLSDWRVEATMLAMHARYLAKRFWKSRIAISFPRVNPHEGDYTPEHAVSDAELVQMIVAMRLLLPDAELVLSTRERAALRDHLVGLGITRMSAGSKTNPGGYKVEQSSLKQFDISDERTPEQVAAMIESRGFEPVWKDFDPTFLHGPL
ncbi:MAG: 2-iminoacetate synthase ThiH [Deltaproteobacteria bacterium]|nr:2-iminoacetate synthase ThiH [Deltaproteobacteria bacterium]